MASLVNFNKYNPKYLRQERPTHEREQKIQQIRNMLDADMKHSEIASALGLKYNTLMSLIYRYNIKPSRDHV